MIPRLALLLAALLPASAAADGLPPGLAAAELAPGWMTADGSRMTALVLELQPGWKTYWRAPGEAGIAPRFDWTGSQNRGAVTLHWPAPQVIDSGGAPTLGFHDRLVLPIEVAPAAPGEPVTLQAAVDFGLCREVCVPAHVSLTAAPPSPAPDPRIEAALAAMPDRLADQPVCRITPIRDGNRVEARLPSATNPEALPVVAVELDGGADGKPVWTSTPDVAVDGEDLRVTTDLVPAAAKPFDLDPAMLRLTLVGADGTAVETLGCAP